MKKVCVVTGTRAEYGLLKPVIDRFYNESDMELQLVVTGMHLSPEFGLTYKEIEDDGYPIASKIEMLLSSDTAVGITKSIGLGLMGFADFFSRNKPDIVVLLGDRYESLAVATAAMIAQIPIAHIHGGELTEGLIDESIRHSITKMSQLHFTSTEEYRNRVIQLGEQPLMVHNVGSLGVENIHRLKLMSKDELERSINFTFNDKVVMVTFHPVTLENQSAGVQFQNLLYVVSKMSIKVIFTKANSDTNGRIINKMIDEYVAVNRNRCIAFTSMGQLRYLSALQYCCAVVGNSSSGIIEVPSFGIPTLNIGDRQRGRICADSVINCNSDKDSIEQALNQALDSDFANLAKKTQNPYEGNNPSSEIVNIIKSNLDTGIDIKKKFYDIR